MIKASTKPLALLLTWASLSWLLLPTTPITAQSVQVRFRRWIEIRQLIGTVFSLQGQTSRPAQMGTRLVQVGDGILTGPRSSTVLAVDNGISFINVSENTTLRIQQLSTNPDGGHVTRLAVTGGQVRLNIRPFTHPSSRLEIQTPAGISGVRGTDFGLSIQPDGKTGVATLEGSVVSSAEGESVMVSAGLQSLIIPGAPPTPPVPLRNDTRLRLRRLTAIDNQRARIVAQVDPVNLVLINDQPQTLSPDGLLDVTVPIPSDRSVTTIVVTPLGSRQIYALAVP